MTKKLKVTIIGASNVDITGFTKHQLIYKDANIGSMKTSAGGVGRNIAENLVRLGFEVSLVSVFGDDTLSKFIINHSKENGINIDNSIFLKNVSTSTFIAIMDEHNDLALGISAMDIYQQISAEQLLSKANKDVPEYVVLETNFSTEILLAAVKKFPNSKIILDSVSSKKALRALAVLPKLYLLKTNLIEAEMMSNITVSSKNDYKKLVDWFLTKGVKNVFITLGKDGVVYGNRLTYNQQKTIPSKVVNTIGAGDSFVAGLIYADHLSLPMDICARYGMAAASITVGHEEAVSPKMSIKKLTQLI